jgi:phage FluMu gp28-like protein
MKKTDNHIAALEKAIKEKYGAETIAHPRSEWDDEKEQDYLDQIKNLATKKKKYQEQNDKVENGGFFISKKLLNRESKRTCPVCETYSFDVRDDIYMNKYECCSKCYIQYVEGREERWKTGWRPKDGYNT